MTMLKPKEMAERLGVTVRTLQKWDKNGLLRHTGHQLIVATTRRNNT